LIARAVLTVCSSLSTEQGPAMIVTASPPMTTSRTAMVVFCG
jgi:hypothetical protein